MLILNFFQQLQTRNRLFEKFKLKLKKKTYITYHISVVFFLV
jgi:hypothetical protein